ncbi:MAG: ATP-dependent zinc metalloprotease FtsH [Dialister sp.]|nr:ATP-dependent zinc metalloprotease FtsH [Dialister sp.]
MNKFVKNVALYVFLMVIAVAIFNTFVHPQDKLAEMAYSDFVSQIEKKNVASVVMTENSIKGKLKDGTEFSTYIPNNDMKIVEKMTEGNVVITAKPPEQPSWWMSLLSSLLPILILVAVWFWIMNQTQGGGGRVMSFGKSRAKMSGEGQVHVDFSDVAGEDEAKEELAEVVDFLKNPGRYTAIGAKIPKGVLLVGPPGTGKTLLAKAVAGEAKVPFFSISGSDFVEMFVGVGASRVRDLFAQAKKNAPCIVFIDEIDAVGRQRGSGLGGGHDEREQTLNQLLVEMDGFGANEGIITLAATNRPDILDPALLRPGRFDRRVVVGRPDLAGRIAILKVHARNKPLDPDIDLKTIAKKIPGFTGADIANLLNEAALLAARENRKTISMADMEEASEKVSYGPERKSHKVSDEERKITAYHESGHAIMATVLKHADPVHKVTIIPRGQAGGYTMMLPQEERSFITKSHLLAQLRVALGGRCAEQIIFNEISSGASGDLQQVTSILRKMIMEWGMSDRLGPMIFGEHQEQIFLGKQLGSERNYGEAVATIIDEEMHKYLDEAYNDTMETLTAHIDVLKAMAKALLDVETINSEQVKNLFKYHSIYPPEEEPGQENNDNNESGLSAPDLPPRGPAPLFGE